MSSHKNDKVVVTFRPYNELCMPGGNPTLTYYPSRFTLKNDPTAEKWCDTFTDKTMVELAGKPFFVPTDGPDHVTIKETVRRHAAIMFDVRGRSIADGLLLEKDKEQFYRDFCEQLLEAGAWSTEEKTVKMGYERDDGRHCVEMDFHLPPFQPSRMTEVDSNLEPTEKYAQSEDLEFQKSPPFTDYDIPPVHDDAKLMTVFPSEPALDMGKNSDDTLRLSDKYVQSSHDTKAVSMALADPSIDAETYKNEVAPDETWFKNAGPVMVWSLTDKP